MVWLFVVTGMSKADRKYCAKIIAFEAFILSFPCKRPTGHKVARTYEVSITTVAYIIDTRNRGLGYACSK